VAVATWTRQSREGQPDRTAIKPARTRPSTTAAEIFLDAARRLSARPDSSARRGGTGSAIAVETTVGPDGAVDGPRMCTARSCGTGEAGLRLRRAGSTDRKGAGGGRRASPPSPTSSPAGARGSGHEGPAPPPRRPDPRDDGGARRVRTRRAWPTCAGREDPAKELIEGLHDRGGTSRPRSSSRAAASPLRRVPAHDRAGGTASSPAGQRPRRAAARGAERSRAPGVSSPAAPG